MPRLVLLTAHFRDGLVQHRYIAQRLAEEFSEDLAAVVVATGTASPRHGSRLLRWWRRYTMPQLFSRTAIRVAHKLTGATRRQQETYRSILFPQGETGRMPGPVVEVPSHNGRECIEILERIQPKLVVIYGTLIIGRKVLEAANCMVNVHTGLSPRYRGSDTIFWALHNGEPEHLGVTVHRVEVGVDSGPVLARGRPAIEPQDNENRLFAKSVKLGAELLCRAIRRELEGTARPLTQVMSEGREYRSVERTLAAERRVRKLVKLGLPARENQQWSEEY